MSVKLSNNTKQTFAHHLLDWKLVETAQIFTWTKILYSIFRDC